MAGENDLENAKKTGEEREINRHNFSFEEIKQSLGKDVVQRFLKLIRFRNEYDAFNGEFRVVDSYEDEIRLSWVKDVKCCTLFIDLKTNKSVIDYVDEIGNINRYLV